MNLSSTIDRVEAGRRLGHDLFEYRWPRPPERAQASILEGFAVAREQRIRQKPADRYHRKWLQLRLSAHQRGRAIADDVTPAWLKRIDVQACPVTRSVLTHSQRVDTDWSIDRLNNDGAYAANNLAVMSTRANRAKGSRSFEEVHALADKAEASEGLDPVEWLRLAAMMLGPCFAADPDHVPILPLAAPIPNGTVRLALQQIQHVITGMAATQSGKNSLIKHLLRASSSEASEWRLRRLAECMHQRLKRQAYPWDAWLQPDVMEALEDWWASLGSIERARAGDISRTLAGSHTVAPDCLRSWHLERRGYC